MKKSKVEKIIGEEINQIIKNYNLYSSLNSLSINLKNRIERLNFPCQIQMIAKGFTCFQNYKKVNLYTENNKEIKELYLFLRIFNHVMKNCNNEIYLEHYKKQFKIKCESAPDSLKGFYHELKVLSKLINDGFKIEDIPESNPNNFPQGTSLSDAIVSKNKKIFHVECKTVSHYKGHPVSEKAALEFLKSFIEDKIYKTICPDDSQYHITIQIDRPLFTKPPKNRIGDAYIPTTLLDQIKLYCNKLDSSILKINIVKNDKIEFLNDDEILATAFQCGYKCPGYSYFHQIIIISESPNNYAEDVYNMINTEINKKNKHPLIFCVEFYEIPESEREKFKKNMTLIFHKHYDKLLHVIISDRLYSKSSDYYLGKEPIEFYTKSMTKFLES